MDGGSVHCDEEQQGSLKEQVLGDDESYFRLVVFEVPMRHARRG